MPDTEFKRFEAPKLGRVGRVVAAFDNEPENCNIFLRQFPDASRCSSTRSTSRGRLPSTQACASWQASSRRGEARRAASGLRSWRSRRASRRHRATRSRPPRARRLPPSRHPWRTSRRKPSLRRRRPDSPSTAAAHPPPCAATARSSLIRPLTTRSSTRSWPCCARAIRHRSEGPRVQPGWGRSGAQEDGPAPVDRFHAHARTNRLVDGGLFPSGRHRATGPVGPGYGHVVLDPDGAVYRVAAPGVLRALLGERRLDVAPSSTAEIEDVGDGAKRVGVRRGELPSRPARQRRSSRSRTCPTRAKAERSSVVRSSISSTPPRRRPFAVTATFPCTSSFTGFHPPCRTPPALRGRDSRRSTPTHWRDAPMFPPASFETPPSAARFDEGIPAQASGVVLKPAGARVPSRPGGLRRRDAPHAGELDGRAAIRVDRRPPGGLAGAWRA